MLLSASIQREDMACPLPSHPPRTLYVSSWDNQVKGGTKSGFSLFFSSPLVAFPVPVTPQTRSPLCVWPLMDSQGGRDPLTTKMDETLSWGSTPLKWWQRCPSAANAIDQCFLLSPLKICIFSPPHAKQWCGEKITKEEIHPLMWDASKPSASLMQCCCSRGTYLRECSAWTSNRLAPHHCWN